MKNLNDILLEDYTELADITEDQKIFTKVMDAAEEVLDIE